MIHACTTQKPKFHRNVQTEADLEGLQYDLLIDVLRKVGFLGFKIHPKPKQPSSDIFVEGVVRRVHLLELRGLLLRV